MVDSMLLSACNMLPVGAQFNRINVLATDGTQPKALITASYLKITRAPPPAPPRKSNCVRFLLWCHGQRNFTSSFTFLSSSFSLPLHFLLHPAYWDVSLPPSFSIPCSPELRTLLTLPGLKVLVQVCQKIEHRPSTAEVRVPMRSWTTHNNHFTVWTFGLKQWWCKTWLWSLKFPKSICNPGVHLAAGLPWQQVNHDMSADVLLCRRTHSCVCSTKEQNNQRTVSYFVKSLPVFNVFISEHRFHRVCWKDNSFVPTTELWCNERFVSQCNVHFSTH